MRSVVSEANGALAPMAGGPGTHLTAPGGVQGQRPGGNPGGSAPESSRVLAFIWPIGGPFLGVKWVKIFINDHHKIVENVIPHTYVYHLIIKMRVQCTRTTGTLFHCLLPSPCQFIQSFLFGLSFLIGVESNMFGLSRVGWFKSRFKSTDFFIKISDLSQYFLFFFKLRTNQSGSG